MNDKNYYANIQDIIKHRWIKEILSSIAENNNIYSEILESIEYLSHTELNRKLAILLEEEAIIKITRGKKITYSMTGFGNDLLGIFDMMEKIGEKYYS